MLSYSAYPIFQANAVEPLILLILDNSGSMNERAYAAAYDHNTQYYGYFEPYKKYTYHTNKFYRDAASGDWDGNFLNWGLMRRVDVVRKVLMGGLATSRAGGGNQINKGEPASSYDFYQYYSQQEDETNWGNVSPCPDGQYFKFSVDGDEFDFYRSTNRSSWTRIAHNYNIHVKKGEDISGNDLPDEDANFLEGNLAGIVQKMWSKARFGLEFFSEGTGTNPPRNGGFIDRTMAQTGNKGGTVQSGFINQIQNTSCDTKTPLAEAYYTAIKYFQQEDPESSYYQINAATCIPNNNSADDPYNNPDPVSCAKAFVILLTDGASYKDLYVPDSLKDYDGDGNDGVTTVDSGTTPEGVLNATPGSDTVKTFYLNYIDGYAAGTTPYPSGTTPFTTSHVGDDLVLYDSNDKQIYYGEITAVNTTYDDWGGTSGTSEITVSGTTNTAEWKSGVSPYTYNLSWRVVTATPNDESGYGSNGSDYLDDLALYARVNDLRNDLGGDQNLLLYTVYAFGNDTTARNLLKDAAKNGGFEDKNGNSRPDLTSEWDTDSDGNPDTYYEASNGYLLESKLIQAINDILKRAAAGTAVSVLATSGEGEGNMIQAYFRPSVSSGVTVLTTTGVTEVNWVGYLQSLWVDAYGNLREDSDSDLTLDVTADKIVTYFLDTETGDSQIKRYSVSGTCPYPIASGTYEVIDLDAINPLWEAGSLLAEKSADDRKIFTYIDKDKDGVADEPSNDDDPFDDDGEIVRFHTSGVEDIQPYFGVDDDTSWDYLGAAKSDRAFNLIEYIRGKETGFSGTTPMNIRTRIIESDVWKLGDIVHSTPVSISKPPDNYHAIYSDESYQEYLSGTSNRETMVYVGANDGMLHAFTTWVYNSGSSSYTRPSAAPGDENIGDEIWAYIPQCLLPHLKWLPAYNYSHVYYVDLKPKICDAQILADDAHYIDSGAADNWGTILLCGMNMGGREICVEDSFDDGSGVTNNEVRTFYPSYVCMDITDPRNPRLLWERTYQDLEMTTSTPAVIRVKEKWFAVFGSGPSDYDGTSDQNAHVFVVDLKTGEAYPNLSEFTSGTTDGWLFQASESEAFMNSPVSFDKELNYNVDAIYFGETYYVSTGGGSWKGKAYKVSVPWDWTATSSYVDNPNDASDPWTFSSLFDATRPITAPMSLSLDSFDNVWVYFGTGRYLGEGDKDNDDTQYLFGIKDPFFNSYYDASHGNYYRNYSSSLALATSDLFDADPYIITTDGSVFNDGSGLSRITDFDELLAAARNTEDQDSYPDYFDGWIRTLETDRERAVTKFSILGGIVFAPTFIPNEDVCGFGGTSNLYGLYYETGTAYYKSVFGVDVDIINISGVEYEKVTGKISLGEGKSSSLGIHVGQQEGAKSFIQQSTGTVLETAIDPALNIKSGLLNWREK